MSASKLDSHEPVEFRNRCDLGSRIEHIFPTSRPAPAPHDGTLNLANHAVIAGRRSVPFRLHLPKITQILSVDLHGTKAKRLTSALLDREASALSRLHDYHTPRELADGIKLE